MTEAVGPVANLTSTPWLKHVDTTVYENILGHLEQKLTTLMLTTSQSGLQWRIQYRKSSSCITSFALSNTGVGSGTSALDGHGILLLLMKRYSSHGMLRMTT